MLDLNLPRCGGLEVLAEMKTDSDLLAIPVVILTTSYAGADIQRSFRCMPILTSPNHSISIASLPP